MAGKKGAGENSKKASGNAKKAEAAAQKQAVVDAKKSAEDDEEWQKGAKGSAKKDAAEAKKADAARKKAEREALLAAEEASQPSKAKGAGAKTAQKKTRGLDLAQLDDTAPATSKAAALNASGIDNALDALSLTAGSDNIKIDRHPERRFKAAYAAFEARRLPEIAEKNPHLRRDQRIAKCKEEFKKSEENPFNQLSASYDARREDIATLKESASQKIETRLGAK